VRLVEVSAVIWPAYTAATTTVSPPGPPRSRPGPDRSSLPHSVRALQDCLGVTAWLAGHGLPLR
jgi:hypothetical protein